VRIFISDFKDESGASFGLEKRGLRKKTFGLLMLQGLRQAVFGVIMK
jgi:hypothetical protein